MILTIRSESIELRPGELRPGEAAELRPRDFRAASRDSLAVGKNIGIIARWTKVAAKTLVYVAW